MLAFTPHAPPPVLARSAVGASLFRSYRMLTPSLARAACGRLPINRRCEMRHSARLGCRVRRIEDWRLLGDRTIDVSPQGMLVLSDEAVDEGTSLVVSFQATELPIWFDTCATVTRIVQGRRPGDRGRALGIHFDTLPAVSRLILRGHLRKLPLVRATREPPIDFARASRPASVDDDYAGAVRRILDADN
jgi:hypothetical protein